MSLKYGSAQIKKVAAILDEPHNSAEDAAMACLGVMEEIFEERAKFVVVGQLSGGRDRAEIPPSDPEAIKLSLGWYSTEGDARSAADGLWFSTASGDRFRTWVLNVFHGTPAELHAKAKEKYAAIEAKRVDSDQERMTKSIAKAVADNEKRVLWWRELCKCSHAREDHKYTAKAGAMRCFRLGCDCPNFEN